MFSSERQPTIFRLRSGSEGFNVLLKFDCRARIEEKKGRRRYILSVVKVLQKHEFIEVVKDTGHDTVVRQPQDLPALVAYNFEAYSMLAFLEESSPHGCRDLGLYSLPTLVNICCDLGTIVGCHVERLSCRNHRP